MTTLSIIAGDKTVIKDGTACPDLSLSWLPSNVWAVQWDGTKGEVEYSDGTPNLEISELGIYAQGITDFDDNIANAPETLRRGFVMSPLTALRTERDGKLTSSDWTQLPDAQLTDSKKAEWITYRQALRDLPATESDPSNPTWPTEPTT
tara:strand:- start:406 stop:852 length:447 start_codon:yes stop_codon:yes gene_type:complete